MFDYFTFIAQVINFLILVALLKHFLYKPIVFAMDKREKEIEQMYDRAKGQVATAEEKGLLLEKKLDELEKVKDERLKEIEEEVELKKVELMQDARQEVKQLEDSWKSSLKSDQERFKQEFKENVQSEIMMIVRRLMAELADQELEKHIILRCFKSIQDGFKEKTKANSKIVLRTRFELDGDTRAEILKELTKILSYKPLLEFEIAPGCIAGVEVLVGGQKASWSVSDYLNKLESQLVESR